MREAAAAMVAEMFALFMDDPARMPQDWAEEAAGAGQSRARVVSDYISGMTDRYAIERHAALTGRLDPVMRAG